MSLTDGITARMMQIAWQREQEGVASVLRHSQEHIDSGKAIKNKDGTHSTFVGVIMSDKRLNDGKETLVPSMWFGKKLDAKKDREKIIANALQSGKKWPSADSVPEAMFLEQQAHKLMEKQVGAK